MIPERLKPYLSFVTFQDYKESRSKCGIPNTKSALHNACYKYYSKDVKKRFSALGGKIVADYEASDHWQPNDARIRIVESVDCISWDDIVGDMFCYVANPSIKPETLEQKAQEFYEKANREGVWSYSAQVWSGNNWETVVSIGGFIGDDFSGSCYDDDLMECAIEALQDIFEKEARELESERPDIYTT